MANIIGLLVSAGTQVYQVFSSKVYADKTYLQILPSLKRAIAQHGRNSKNAIELLEAIAGLPAFGARRKNFRKRYLDKSFGWRELPDNPKDLPYGVWH